MSEFDWFQRPTPEAEAAEDALAWAKEAYARLKAQQQGSQPEVETVEKVEAVKEVEIVEEPKPTEEPKLEEQKPVVSLLEQAAAKREERLASLAQEAPPAEPELGQLDADFLWSAEVLAAQGRSAAQVSIEEIDWLAKLRAGMEKTRQGFVTQLLENLGDDPLSEKSLEEIESLLLRADVGVESTDQSLDRLRKRMNEGVLDATEALGLLKQELREQLEKPLSNKGV